MIEKWRRWFGDRAEPEPQQPAAGDALFRPLIDSDTWDEARSKPLVFVYKHSPICYASSQARLEVVRFAEMRDGIPFYEIDVRACRDLSMRIAAELDIRHESPQIILLSDGQPRWHASHWGIKLRNLEAALSGGD